jgi:GNAT superfamily N-acetyltransferase
MPSITVRLKEKADQPWVERVLTQSWGSTVIATNGRIIDAAALPALVAGSQVGLATFEIDEAANEAHLVTLNALVIGRGIGSALVEALADSLADMEIAALRVSTTNDRLDALRFYQRRGFRLVAVQPGALDEARRLKPSIPLVGDYGIAMRDRIDLIRELSRG